MSRDLGERLTLRVTGHATLEATCDTAMVEVVLGRTATSPGRAVAAVRSAADRLDQVLSRFDAVVAGATRRPFQWNTQPDAEGGYRATMNVEVRVHNTPLVADLLRAVCRLRPDRVSDPVWDLASDNPVFTYVRKAALGEALASARAMAEVLRVEVCELVWVSADTAPVRLDTDGPITRVRDEVLAQFTTSPADLRRTP